jgi:hypothetical protein
MQMQVVQHSLLALDCRLVKCRSIKFRLDRSRILDFLQIGGGGMDLGLEQE